MAEQLRYDNKGGKSSPARNGLASSMRFCSARAARNVVVKTTWAANIPGGGQSRPLGTGGGGDQGPGRRTVAKTTTRGGGAKMGRPRSTASAPSTIVINKRRHLRAPASDKSGEETGIDPGVHLKGSSREAMPPGRHARKRATAAVMDQPLGWRAATATSAGQSWRPTSGILGLSNHPWPHEGRNKNVHCNHRASPVS